MNICAIYRYRQPLNQYELIDTLCKAPFALNLRSQRILELHQSNNNNTVSLLEEHASNIENMEQLQHKIHAINDKMNKLKAIRDTLQIAKMVQTTAAASMSTVLLGCSPDYEILVLGSIESLIRGMAKLYHCHVDDQKLSYHLIDGTFPWLVLGIKATKFAPYPQTLVISTLIKSPDIRKRSQAFPWLWIPISSKKKIDYIRAFKLIDKIIEERGITQKFVDAYIDKLKTEMIPKENSFDLKTVVRKTGETVDFIKQQQQFVRNEYLKKSISYKQECKCGDLIPNKTIFPNLHLIENNNNNIIDPSINTVETLTNLQLNESNNNNDNETQMQQEAMQIDTPSPNQKKKRKKKRKHKKKKKKDKLIKNTHWIPDYWSHDWEIAFTTASMAVFDPQPMDLLCFFHYNQAIIKHIASILKPWYLANEMFYKQLRVVVFLPFLKKDVFEKVKTDELNRLYTHCTEYKDNDYYLLDETEQNKIDEKIKKCLEKYKNGAETIKFYVLKFCNYYNANFGDRYNFDSFQMLYRDDLTTNPQERSNRTFHEILGSTTSTFGTLCKTINTLDIDIHNQWKRTVVYGYFPPKQPVSLAERDEKAKTLKQSYINNTLMDTHGITSEHNYLLEMARIYSDRMQKDFKLAEKNIANQQENGIINDEIKEIEIQTEQKNHASELADISSELVEGFWINVSFDNIYNPLSDTMYNDMIYYNKNIKQPNKPKEILYIFDLKQFETDAINITDVSLQYLQQLIIKSRFEVSDILDDWQLLDTKCKNIRNILQSLKAWKQTIKKKKTISMKLIQKNIKHIPSALLYAFVASRHGKKWYPGYIAYLKDDTAIIIWPNEDEIYFDPIPNFAEAVANESIICIQKNKFKKYLCDCNDKKINLPLPQTVFCV